MTSQYKAGSRFVGNKEYEFNGKAVVFQKDFDLSTIAKYYSIKAGQEHRPDLISLEVYKRDDLGWVIMQANKLDHISQLTVNLSLIIPNISGEV